MKVPSDVEVHDHVSVDTWSCLTYCSRIVILRMTNKEWQSNKYKMDSIRIMQNSSGSSGSGLKWEPTNGPQGYDLDETSIDLAGATSVLLDTISSSTPSFSVPYSIMEETPESKAQSFTCFSLLPPDSVFCWRVSLAKWHGHATQKHAGFEGSACSSIPLRSRVSQALGELVKNSEGILDSAPKV